MTRTLDELKESWKRHLASRKELNIDKLPPNTGYIDETAAKVELNPDIDLSNGSWMQWHIDR